MFMLKGYVISTDGIAELRLIQLWDLMNVCSLNIPAMYRMNVIKPAVHPAPLQARSKIRITPDPCSMAVLDNLKVSSSL